MPYLGNTPSTSFATIVKDTFNGGSTGYTLSKVATTNSVSVFVENVRQEPTSAYSVSGTTLTFTATTPSGTGNIYVLHMNPTTTTTHPAAQNLTAVNGTFTGNIDVDGGAVFNEDSADVDFRVESNGNANMLFIDGGNDVIGIKTATPTNYYADDLVITAPDEGGITVVGGTAERNYLAFADGTSGDARYRGLISYDHNTDKLGIGAGGGTKIELDGNGVMTNATQPAFHATSTGSGFGHDSIMVFNTAHVNTGSHYNTSNGKFTAPVAGVYFFYHKNIGTSSSTVIRVKVYYNDSIFTAYKTPSTRQDTSTGNDYAEGVINFVVSLSANDTIKLGAFADDSSSGIYNDNSNGQGFNYFGGYLIG
tara:strand:+ start:712 stop:1806 length:1095 start_codon:yes stop_codon:yes gene_type:complete